MSERSNGYDHEWLWIVLILVLCQSCENADRIKTLEQRLPATAVEKQVD